ncbi:MULTISPECIES: CPBP family intramembrane glutamic endopeptidase [unclassified Blastococcus]
MTALRPELSEGQARRLLVERTVLDEQVRAARDRDPGSWGLRTWLGPLAALAGVLVLSHAAALYDGPGGTVLAVAVLIGGELLLLGALLASGRPVAARAGGWRAAFGLDRVRKRDWLPWLVGFLVIYACRTAVVSVAAVLSDGRALEESSNLPTGDPTVLGVVVLVLAAVVLAPVTEELMFRGLLLRSFMRRMRFWPAALLSSLLFALFHVHQVETLLGAVTLALSVGALGLGNCFVVRITGRLAPAIMVHATYNALAIGIGLALSG